ncbi:MAG: hypothetical protein JO148_14285 [Acidimicrobiia bacterium]|nr:hypothetical protein [Acidimicrobiia bacterium]
MSDQHPVEDDEPEDGPALTFPVRRQATPQQALVAIAFVFFLGVAIGFLLCRTF